MGMFYLKTCFYRCLICVLYLWFGIYHLHAKADTTDTLYLPMQTEQVRYDANIAYWEDASNHASLTDAQAATFKPLNLQMLPASKHPRWFKLSVQSKASQAITWVFATNWVPIDFLDVWVVSENQTQYFALGDHRLFKDRVIKSHLPAFPVVLAPHAQATIYLRASGMSLVTMIGSLSPLDVFLTNDKKVDIGYGIYFGLLTMMALIAFVVGAWIKDHAMLGYSGHISSIMLNCFGILGYAEVLFSNSIFAVSDVTLGVCSLGLLFFSSWMWIHILQLKAHYKNLYLLYIGMMVFSVLAIPLVFGPYYSELHQFLRWINYPCNLIPLFILTIKWRKFKRIEDFVYLLSFISIFCAAIFYVLMQQNILALSLNGAHFYLYMLLLNIVIMSIGMAFRVRQIQLDKIAADNKADLALQRTQEERRFVAMLSHEFRNPLVAIDRSAQMLSLTNPDIGKTTSDRFNSIRGSVSRLMSLVDNFLMSERLEEGHSAINVSNHTTKALIKDIRTHFAERDWARIELVCLSGNFEFDLTLLSMAVSNLLHNALRYAYSDAKIKLIININQSIMTILVSDAGPGVSEEEMQMLGTPYYRASSSYGKKGTGLGYYFCKRIVDLHMGALIASKNQFKGLDVMITLKK